MNLMSVRSPQAGPLVLLGIVLLGVLGPGPIASVRAQEDPDPPRVVRSIRFERGPIFGEGDRERLGWLPLGLVNAFHVDTRIGVIRRELVFAEGERVDRERLEESERKLRETGLFGEAWVEAVAVGPDSVDVVVRTRELWTTSVEGSYERFKDQDLWSIQLRERNLLGTARSLVLARDVDEDRTSWTLGLGDRSLFGTRWRLNSIWRDSDDGETLGWTLRRPFFRLDADWAMELNYRHQGIRPRYYLTGTQYVRPHEDVTRTDVIVERRLATTKNGVWRVGAGYRHRHQRFNPAEDLVIEDAGGETGAVASLGLDVAENRELHMPTLVLSRVSRRYTRQRYLFAMGRVEDIPLGHELRLWLGWPNEAWESSDSALHHELREQWFFRHGEHIHRLTLHTEGLLKGSGGENLQAKLELATYRAFGRSLRVALGALGGISSDLDRHESFFLGVDNGLRAARFREFAGDRLLRCNAELRWVHVPGILGLVTPGLTAFLDLGTAWYEEESDLMSRNMRGAVGLGFRLGFNRGATEVPIRFDLAWPILYQVDREAPILSIGTGQVF